MGAMEMNMGNQMNFGMGMGMGGGFYPPFWSQCIILNFYLTFNDVFWLMKQLIPGTINMIWISYLSTSKQHKYYHYFYIIDSN
jgi:hypothetical protein